MNKNLSNIADELFGKIRTQFPKVKLRDEDRNTTDEPELARFFNFDYHHNRVPLGAIDISISEKDGLVIIYSNDIVEEKDEFVKNKFYNFLQELREFAKQRLMNFDTRDISKSNLDKRDYEFMSKKNNGEDTMSESKLYGTSKTSYQQLGDAKLIVKHSAPVNFENPAGRAQRIESIYIENAQGERFKYPFKHLNGARALATHVAHGGTPYDSIGGHVIGLSEELSNLRMFKQYVARNPMVSEAMGSIHTKVMERIDAVKKEIHSLQSATRYVEFAENFHASDAKEIPEDVMNDWIDRLTIRTFNEELKNVFPYIFKLIDEGDIPVKELSADDLLAERVTPEWVEVNRKAKELGMQTVAVGTVFEAKSVLEQGISQVLIMDPVKDTDELAFKELSALNPSSLLLTISCIKDAQNVGKTPIVIEGITSMSRFGLGINELSSVSNLNIKAFSLHLPIENPAKSKVTEISDWISAYQTHCPNADKVVYLSHVSESELKSLTSKYPDFKFKLRIGTKLWIGDLKAFQIKSTILEVHEPATHNFGYRQRGITNKHRLVIVSGGTAHGIGLQAPRSNVTLKQRLVAILSGVLEAFDYSLSPFVINGKQRWFAESPHMNVSLLKLPANSAVPKVGSTISAQVRMTTTNFDCVVIN